MTNDNGMSNGVNMNTYYDIHGAFCMSEIEDGTSIMARTFSYRDMIMVFEAMSIKYPLVMVFDKDRKEVRKYQNI